MINHEFGQYRLSRFLGYGSFGDIYLGEHIDNHTLAAVQMIGTRLTAEDLKEFINEASTIFRLQHPHIVQLLDFGIGPANTPFLTMDYAAANVTLRQRYPKGTRLPLQSIIAYVGPLASALQYAHDQRLIHGDVKPKNILLGRNDEIWLSDFGIASVPRSEMSLDAEMPIEAVPYIAPEALLHRKACPASDQYALGVIVYEWLCGERPFGGWVSKHCFTPPPSLREKIPTISPDVEQVVMTALAIDPVARWASVQAFAMALQAAAGAQPRLHSGSVESRVSVGGVPTSSMATPMDEASPATSPATKNIFQMTAVVGQKDSVNSPSIFFAFDLQEQATILELPGGDFASSTAYSGPFLSGSNVSVTLRFQKVIGDSLPDMIVYAGQDIEVFGNSGISFSAMPSSMVQQNKLPGPASSNANYPLSWTNAVVGHGDSATHPSDFLAANIRGKIVVFEFMGGSSSSTMVYVGPDLSGSGEDQSVPTLLFSDRNHDGKMDMIIHVAGHQFVFYNTGPSFRPSPQ